MFFPLCEVLLCLDELPGCNLRILSRWTPFWFFTLFLEFERVWKIRVFESLQRVAKFPTGRFEFLELFRVETGGSLGLWPPQVHDSSGWGCADQNSAVIWVFPLHFECHQKQRAWGRCSLNSRQVVRRWMRNVETRRRRAGRPGGQMGSPGALAVQHTSCSAVTRYGSRQQNCPRSRNLHVESCSLL